MQQIEVTYLQMVLIGIGVGAFLGLIPLILGVVMKRKKLGFLGFISSIAAGAVWSVIALLVALVFAVVIVVKRRTNAGESAHSDNNTAAEDAREPVDSDPSPHSGDSSDIHSS